MNSPSSSSSSSSSVRPRDKWFNLALRECPAALESFDIGRRSTLEPLVVDVVLVARPFDQMNSPGGRELIRNFSGKEYHSDQDDCEGKNEQIIERWVVQYDNRKVRERRSSSNNNNNKLQVMYKKATLLLRSLFVMVRLLPAYKIFRELNSSGQIFKFELVPKVPTISPVRLVAAGFGVSGGGSVSVNEDTDAAAAAAAAAYYIVTAGFIGVSRRTRRQTQLPASTKRIRVDAEC